ncbi:MAG: GAF domain-containing protein [Litoreibacter sp.]|nr:GAF domain-containing protein [Litoreibacter sp.]
MDKVIATVHSGQAAARSRLAASWRRSLVSHGLDPATRHIQDYHDASEVAERQDRLGRVMRVAAPTLDRLFELVGNSGCGIVLTDADGIVLDHRFTDADHDAFYGWGLGLGSDWSEASEGTNGIGTCLAENRPVTIHRSEHFMARNTEMSCIDAPIYGADGQIVAALDVSSARADQTQAINGLIAEMVQQTARKIEADNFRDRFKSERIIVADQDDSTAMMLLAVDRDDIVVGATRGARKVYGMSLEGAVTPIPARDLFGADTGPTGFENAERAAVVRALVRADHNVSKAARNLGISRATLYRRMRSLGLGD